jgi:hypothetical protein
MADQRAGLSLPVRRSATRLVQRRPVSHRPRNQPRIMRLRSIFGRIVEINHVLGAQPDTPARFAKHMRHELCLLAARGAQHRRAYLADADPGSDGRARAGAGLHYGAHPIET